MGLANNSPDKAIAEDVTRFISLWLLKLPSSVLENASSTHGPFLIRPKTLAQNPLQYLAGAALWQLSF